MVLTIVLAGCADGNGPNDGVLLVSTSTSGTSPDLNGYRLTVDGADSVSLQPTGSVAIGVQPGRHALRLLGIAPECAVTSDSVLQVTVTSDDTVSVAFDVGCPGPNPIFDDGTLLISTSTSGTRPDLAGYRLTVDGVDSVSLQPTGTVAIGVQPGRHALRLLGVGPQCVVVSSAIVQVDVAPRDTAPVAFDIRCEATAVLITVSTTGSDLDTDGYHVLIDGAERAQVQPSDTTLILLDPGSYTIALTGLGANCTANPAAQAVTVADHQVTATAFAVSCTATNGVIGILIQESGPAVYASFEPLLDGEPLAADPERYPGELVTFLPGERHYLNRVAAGEHRVSLAPGYLCVHVTGPQSVTVSGGGGDTVNLVFSVTCPVPPGDIATLRISAPTTGSTPSSTQYTVRYSVAGYWDYGFGDFAPLSSIEPNGTRFIQVPESDFGGGGLYWYTFGLDGVPSSCKAKVPSHDPMGFVLTAGDTLDLTIQVTCPP
jgi:hypothetical protein